jgi:LPXTG-motif cell wall-anchored protein
MVNTAAVTSSTADPTPGDNSSSVPTVVVPGGGGDGGDDGDDGNGGGDNPGDLPQTGAVVGRDATLAVLLLILGFALVLVSRRRPDADGVDPV